MQQREIQSSLPTGKYINLDEPGVLTPAKRTAFQNLKRLREEGKTIILITRKLKKLWTLRIQ